mgnify:CR=1 FL=1
MAVVFEFRGNGRRVLITLDAVEQVRRPRRLRGPRICPVVESDIAESIVIPEDQVEMAAVVKVRKDGHGGVAHVDADQLLRRPRRHRLPLLCPAVEHQHNGTILITCNEFEVDAGDEVRKK